MHLKGMLLLPPNILTSHYRFRFLPCLFPFLCVRVNRFGLERLHEDSIEENKVWNPNG